MVYKILADSVVLIHFLWIIFLFLGGFWGKRSRFVKILHLSGLAFALILQIFDWFCPLTYLEAWLRSKHHPYLTYAGSFLVHYAEKIIYLEIPPSIILVFTLLLCGFNVLFYLKKKSSSY